MSYEGGSPPVGPEARTLYCPGGASDGNNMPLSTVHVTSPPIDERRIPEVLAPGARLLGELFERGEFERVAGHLVVSRRGGHTERGLLAFLLVFLMAGPRGGVRPFYTNYRVPLRRVAAVAGLRAIPSSGAISRALGVLSPGQSRAFTDAALMDIDGVDKLLLSPTVAHRDSFGESWHVNDLDPSVQTFRQRSLPEGTDLPEPVRIAPGEPGHMAHYRGEFRTRHIPIIHSGSALWLAYRLLAEDPAAMSSVVRELVAQAVQVQCRAGIARERIIIRCDGEFGSAGVMGTILREKVHFLTRLSRYKLLDREDVAGSLASAVWDPVESSTEHRKREAAELGSFLLYPSEGSADDGAEPVMVRVVAVRHRCDGKPDHGVLRDGYQVELFATSLPADCWPASAIAELYAGRASLENRFAQEDREMGLGRTFSYHVPGQEWVTAVGLYLWNLLIVLGFLTDPPQQALPEQRPHQYPSIEPPPSGTIHASEVLEGEPPHPVSATPDVVQVAEAVDVVDVVDVAEPTHETRNIAGIVGEAYRDVLQRPGWTADPALPTLTCPAGKRLILFSVANVGPSRPRPQAIVRTDVGACDGCTLRSACFASAKPRTYKQLAGAVSPEQAEQMKRFLAERGRVPQALRPQRQPPPRSPTSPISTKARERPLYHAPERSTPGTLRPAAPTFRAREARRLMMDSWTTAVVEITVSAALPVRKFDRLAHADLHGSRHGRKTLEARRRSWSSPRAEMTVRPQQRAR